MTVIVFDGKKDGERLEKVKSGEITGFRAYRKTTLTYARRMEAPFLVDTLEGIHTGKAGDYLAVGAHGEMYPIDAAVFDTTYVEDV